MTTRRGFLGAMFAACAAPAIVKASSIMQIDTRIVAPKLWTFEALPDVVHDSIYSGEIGTVDNVRFIQEAFADPKLHRELGKVMAEELYLASNRKGFTRRVLEREDQRMKKLNGNTSVVFMPPDYLKDFKSVKFPGQVWPK